MRSTMFTTPLVSLKAGGIDLADSNEDVRGRKVVDRDGQEIGKVDDVFVDPNQRRARFIAVKSGDILGLGGRKFLIPVDAIQSSDAEQIVIAESRDRILGGPQVEDELDTRQAGGELDTAGGTMAAGEGAEAGDVDQGAPELVIAVYEWYDVSQPYWSPEYQGRNWA